MYFLLCPCCIPISPTLSQGRDWYATRTREEPIKKIKGTINNCFMEPLDIIILLGMVVSTLLLWFIQHVNNKVCALNCRMDFVEKTLNKNKIQKCL